jgi:hypothetical protein
MKEMPDQCCIDASKPDFDMIKQFMGRSGKSEFSNTALQMLKEFCSQERKPGMANMRQITESRRCQMPESAQQQ